MIYIHLQTIEIKWNDYAMLGQRGDYISGTIGTLISIAGILAILIAYLSQRKQIFIQEVELKELKNARFEDKFNTLLNNFLYVRNNINDFDNRIGITVFKEIYNYYHSQIKNELQINHLDIDSILNPEIYKKKLPEFKKIVSNILYERNKSFLQYYLQNFFYILDFLYLNLLKMESDEIIMEYAKQFSIMISQEELFTIYGYLIRSEDNIHEKELVWVFKLYSNFNFETFAIIKDIIKETYNVKDFFYEI